MGVVDEKFLYAEGGGEAELFRQGLGGVPEEEAKAAVFEVGGVVGTKAGGVKGAQGRESFWGDKGAEARGAGEGVFGVGQLQLEGEPFGAVKGGEAL